MTDDERTTGAPGGERQPGGEPETGNEPGTDHEQETDPDTEPTEVIEASGPRRLLRSRDDRMVVGVAGGLGRYFAVDPVIFRIAFAVSVFFGGLGALAYIALALFVPSDPAPDGEESAPPVARSRWLAVGVGIVLALIAVSAASSLLFWNGGWDGDGPWGLLVLAAIGGFAYLILRDREPGQPISGGRVVAAVALAIAATLGLGMIAALSAFAGATGSGTVVALVVIAIGALLAVAAFRGGARWLIAPALALAIPLGAVSAADISFAGSVGERYYRPLASNDLPDRYELGVGKLIVDLRGLEWDQRSAVPLELDLGLGEAVVVVPEEVCVSPDLQVGAGEIEIGSRRAEGVDLDEQGSASIADGPSLALTAQVDAGSLRVLSEWDPDARRSFGRFDDRGGEARAAVC